MYSVQTVYAIFEMLVFLASVLCLKHLITTKSARSFGMLLGINVLGMCTSYYYCIYLIMQTVIFWALRKNLRVRSIYFIVFFLLLVLFLCFIKSNYDAKQYFRYKNWPKNDFKRSVNNIIYLPYNYTPFDHQK